MAVETEVKITISNINELKQKLQAVKAELFKARALQSDVYFDNKKKLKKTDQSLRLRDNVLLTYKGPKQSKQMKIREEIEIMVDNGKNLVSILEKVGYLPAGKKEKYRESYVLGLTKIFIDETPMGNFIEIEGTKEGVLKAAEKLGFTKKQFIIESYTKLWKEYADKSKIKGDMVFSK